MPPAARSSIPIAQHDIPDVLVANKLASYAPFATQGDAGNLKKAEAEMRQSKYDPNHDGKCDVSSACTMCSSPSRTTRRGATCRLL